MWPWQQLPRSRNEDSLACSIILEVNVYLVVLLASLQSGCMLQFTPTIGRLPGLLPPCLHFWEAEGPLLFLSVAPDDKLTN